MTVTDGREERHYVFRNIDGNQCSRASVSSLSVPGAFLGPLKAVLLELGPRLVHGLIVRRSRHECIVFFDIRCIRRLAVMNALKFGSVADGRSRTDLAGLCNGCCKGPGHSSGFRYHFQNRRSAVY
jgi:hypothetical protein